MCFKDKEMEKHWRTGVLTSALQFSEFRQKMLFKWQKRGIDKQICQLRLCAVVWQTVFEDATCFWNCHFAHTHIHNVCIWELLSLIVFVFIFIVMHNGLSCQCVSVVPAGGAIFGEAVRRHKPAPCNQLYFYFLYFVFVCWFFCIVYSFDVLCILI